MEVLTPAVNLLQLVKGYDEWLAVGSCRGMMFNEKGLTKNELAEKSLGTCVSCAVGLCPCRSEVPGIHIHLLERLLLQ